MLMVLANLPLVAFATSFCQPSACSFVVRNICRNCERQVTRNILSIVVSRSASETEQGRGMHRALTVEAPRGIVLVHGGVPLPTRQRGAARSLVSTAPPPHLPLSQARLEARPPCQSGSHAMIARHLRLGLVGACSLATAHVRRRRGGGFRVYAS
jgi:hypothetical protein